MSCKRIWTEEQISNIKKLYCEAGLSIKEISRKYATRTQTISDILKENGIKIRSRGTSKNTLLNHFYFHNIDSAEKAYFLGLLFTDGSIALDKRRSPNLSLELVETDVEIIKILKNNLNSNSSLYYNKRRDRENGTFTFSVRSAQIVEDLSKWNIVPNKTYKITELKIPNKFEIDFLRGFIDGDGSIWRDKWGHPHTSVCGHSENIIKQVAILGNFLIKENVLNKIGCHNGVYRYVWNGAKADKLNKIIYYKDCICIARKKDKAITFSEDN